MAKAAPDRPNLGLALILTAIGAVLLFALARTYWPFFSDDAFISLRYARRLLDGHGLTWTDGERVEGYSNLLWVLACAALGRLGMDLVSAARWLGVAGMTLAIAAVPWTMRPRSLRQSWPALAGILAIALAGPMAAWAMAGLEQPLLSALWAWSLALWLRRWDEPELTPRRVAMPGVLAAMICLTRPDAPLLVVALAGGVAVARHGLRDGRGEPVRGTVQGIAHYMLWPAVAVLAQLVFRLFYYGDWVPNTAHVKLALAWPRIASGGGYVTAAVLWHLPLVVALATVLPIALGDARTRRRLLLLAVPLVSWLAYVWLVGGDSFPAHRFWIPIVIALALALSISLEAARGVESTRVLWVPATLLLLLAAGQWFDPHGRVARQERWEWDGEVVGRFLATAFGEQQPLLAIDPAGAVPYFSNLPAVDMLGLSDRDIGRAHPENFGAGMAGHESGDGDRVLAMSPDLVLFCNPAGNLRPCFRSGKSMALDPRFVSDYLPVCFEGTDPFPFRSRIYVRHTGRLGIVREEGHVLIPGWLLASNPESVARLDAGGRVVMGADDATPAALLGMPLDPGRWRVATDAGGAPTQVRVLSSASGETLAEGQGAIEFTTDATDRPAVDLVCWPAGGGVSQVRAMTLTRVVPVQAAGGAPLAGPTRTVDVAPGGRW